jgi:hypothetical protein
MSKDRQVAGEGRGQPSSQAAGATPPEQRAGAWSPRRRGFLLGTGGVAAAALVGGSGGFFYSRYGQEPITAAAIQELRGFAVEGYQNLHPNTAGNATSLIR